MKRSLWLLALATWASCSVAGPSPPPASPPSPEPYTWQLPKGFPVPVVPTDNPMSDSKVELGRHLFYDTRLSVTGDVSCATCHQQALAFTDGNAGSIGATGEIHRRGAMSLANVAYSLSLNWDGFEPMDLETQLLTPLFGQDPVEMGLPRTPAALEPLRRDDPMMSLFHSAFPDDSAPVSFDNLAKALAAFQRTLISGDAPYDRYWNHGDEDALSPAQKRGMGLFFSSRLSCSECHRRFNFSGPLRHQGSRPRRAELHNTGLYNLEGGAYPDSDQGRFEQTREPSDMGRFRPPTLRNIAVTAPYMHDGSIATLDGVLDHYAAGGRTVTSGPHAGIGRDNPWKSEEVQGFTLSAEERRDLLAFLHSLTDDTFLQNPRFARPDDAAPPSSPPSPTVPNRR